MKISKKKKENSKQVTGLESLSSSRILWTRFRICRKVFAGETFWCGQHKIQHSGQTGSGPALSDVRSLPFLEPTKLVNNYHKEVHFDIVDTLSCCINQ